MIDKTLAPPPELDYGIRVDKYQEIAEEYSRHCRTLAWLSPDSKILDVGCGFCRSRLGFCRFFHRQEVTQELTLYPTVLNGPPAQSPRSFRISSSHGLTCVIRPIASPAESMLAPFASHTRTMNLISYTPDPCSLICSQPTWKITCRKFAG